MTTTTLVRFISPEGLVRRTIHAAKHLPDTYWAGVTYCGRRGEGVSGKWAAGTEVTCKHCKRAMAGR